MGKTLYRNFTERFKNITNENVPRTILHTGDEIRITTGNWEEEKEPKNGFIQKYAKE